MTVEYGIRWDEPHPPSTEACESREHAERLMRLHPWPSTLVHRTITTSEWEEVQMAAEHDNAAPPADGDAQRADHFQHLYEQASEGNCGHSGMPLPVCKASICDCFDFPWVQPDKAAADVHFGVTAPGGPKGASDD